LFVCQSAKTKTKQKQNKKQKMVQAWFMDDSKDDQRLPHKTDPVQMVSLEQLAAIGVLYWHIPTSELTDCNPDTSPALSKIRKERHYVNFDVLTLSPDKLPNYEEKLKIFYSEHLHVDEEIRYILEGSGYFDIRDFQDRWIRILVESGDMIVLPAGMYHRFTMDSNNYTKAMRLFQEEPKWIAYNRGADADNMDARKKFVEIINDTKESPNGTAYILNNHAKSIANYPHMREINGMLYVAGTSSRNADNSIRGATQKADGSWDLDIKEQTRGVIENIRKILQSAGAGLEHLVDVTIFLIDMKDYRAMNEVYNEYFNAQNGPARTTVAVRELPIPQLLIEIKAVAVKPQ